MAQNCLPDGSDALPPPGVSTTQWEAMIDRNRQELHDLLLPRAVQDRDENDCKLEERASEEGAERVKDIDERGFRTHLSPTHTHAPGVSKSPRDELGKNSNIFCVAPFFFSASSAPAASIV